MAELTTNITKFGAKGVSDPSVFFPTVGYRREIDFSQCNVAASTNYEFLPIPKGFVATAIAVEEIETCDGTSNTVTVKLKSDNSVTLASALSVGGDNLAFSAAALSRAITADDMACIVMAAATTKGKIGVSLIGYYTSEETLVTAACPAAWRKKLQTQDNVSGGQMDPRVQKYENLPS